MYRNNREIEDNITNNDKLHRQLDSLANEVRNLRSINAQLQQNYQNITSRRTKACGHTDICGCDKDLCLQCKRIRSCSHCDEYTVNCNKCWRKGNTCDDRICRTYYTTRFDNCSCNHDLCPDCNDRTTQQRIKNRIISTMVETKFEQHNINNNNINE